LRWNWVGWRIEIVEFNILAIYVECRLRVGHTWPCLIRDGVKRGGHRFSHSITFMSHGVDRVVEPKDWNNNNHNKFRGSLSILNVIYCQRCVRTAMAWACRNRHCGDGYPEYEISCLELLGWAPYSYHAY
jgi:hypothetical protein